MRHRLIFVGALALILGLATGAATAPAQEATGYRGALESRIADLERRAEAVTQNESRDLAAQESMAKSADAMINISLVQIWLAIIGSAGLGLTVFYTRETFKTARLELESARDMASPQLGFHSFAQTAGGSLDGRYTFTNRGQTSTKNARWKTGASCVPGRPNASNIEPMMCAFKPLSTVSGGGATQFVTVLASNVISAADAASIFAGNACLVVWIVIEYDDIFGRTHQWAYRELRTGPALDQHWADGS